MMAPLLSSTNDATTCLGGRSTLPSVDVQEVNKLLPTAVQAKWNAVRSVGNLNAREPVINALLHKIINTALVASILHTARPPPVADMCEYACGRAANEVS
jgi:hypothetical protein